MKLPGWAWPHVGPRRESGFHPTVAELLPTILGELKSSTSMAPNATLAA
jgi:hypothetical protein